MEKMRGGGAIVGGERGAIRKRGERGTRNTRERGRQKDTTYFFIGVSVVLVRCMALALLTRMSMPPNLLTAWLTAFSSCESSRMSTTHGRHLPPAASTLREEEESGLGLGLGRGS